MRVGLGAVEQPARLQVGNDQRVSVFDILSAPWAHFRDKSPRLGDRLKDGEVILQRRLHIVRAKGRGEVHQPGTLGGGDEISHDDEIGGLVRQGESE